MFVGLALGRGLASSLDDVIALKMEKEIEKERLWIN